MHPWVIMCLLQWLLPLSAHVVDCIGGYSLVALLSPSSRFFVWLFSSLFVFKLKKCSLVLVLLMLFSVERRFRK